MIDPAAAAGGLAEEFRIIKRQLLLGTGERGGIDAAKRQIILVCSAQPGDGKTYCAANLALSMASEKDLEVLLVDGDFAKPNIPSLFGFEAREGLMDAIADPDGDPNRFIHRTDIGGLSILPAGARVNNDTELLASARTSEVLRKLTADHKQRILIFDSPPTLAASPATVLATHAGQIMMVVRADRTTDTDLREALSLLSACDNISLMLNGTNLAVSGRRFGSYYGYGNDE
jgi:exopolysaccharide/PEP-CTERM locus tyrosine autokinase